MQVRDLMTADPVACLATDTCAAVGAAMRSRRCGFIPIVESQATKRLLGVVTDRDVALHLASIDRAASDVRVEACMTRDPKAVGPDADLEEAARMMEAIAVHRLPVVEHGRVVGVLSLKDIALAARKQWAYSGPHVAERQMTEIIEAIAAAHVSSRG